ncbi:hypothetical protein FMUAM8_49260 [Nocardia cyriacigeorgica]|nr:hypothetical protein FMUAM8_49260 [Nocardia cyriacigeorgica]BDU08563.1 hypothetical protein FMUBM48_48260 [Nocardia cyriacigeorgica]
MEVTATAMATTEAASSVTRQRSETVRVSGVGGRMGAGSSSPRRAGPSGATPAAVPDFPGRLEAERAMSAPAYGGVSRST